MHFAERSYFMENFKALNLYQYMLLLDLLFSLSLNLERGKEPHKVHYSNYLEKVVFRSIRKKKYKL